MCEKDKRDDLFDGELGSLMVLSYVVLRNNLLTNRYIERVFEMPVQAWSCLYAVGRYPGIRAKEIAELFPRPQNTISRAIALLERRGLVRQESSARDKREKRVLLLPEGRDVLARMTLASLSRQSELFSGLSPAEQATFHRLAHKIAVSAGLNDTRAMDVPEPGKGRAVPPRSGGGQDPD